MSIMEMIEMIIMVTITIIFEIMRTQQIIALSLFLILIVPNAYPQKDKSLQDIFFTIEGHPLDRNQVQYNQPEGFVFENKSVQLKCLISEKYKYKAIPIYYFSHFLSEDSNFVVCTSIPPIYCKRNDSIHAYTPIGPEMDVEMNTFHISRIMSDFFRNTGERVTSLSKLPITYKSSKYAHESFNADTVITYPLKMWQKYENKYTHCLVIMLQKRYRGCIFLYCLYTDKAAKKLNRYVKSLKKVFWYRNPKDYIEVIDPEVKDIYILPERNKSNTIRIVGCL